MLIFIVSALVYTGGKKEEPGTAVEDKELRVVLYVNGNLGDKSFFDSANRGLQRSIEEFGIRGRTVEGGIDPSKWEPDIAQLAAGNWDIVIAGTWQVVEFVQKIAPQHPDKYFITYDAAVDFSQGNLDNVYSMVYKQNEGSFLVGALAAILTTSDLPFANDIKIIGFLGGQDIPVINDFRMGYEQGAQYISPDVRVIASYVGSFGDPAKGKELALAQFDQGADISFNVAAESGLGLIDAAYEAKKYAIGVDSDQYLLFKDSDPEKAKHIVTSMMKNVDNSVYRAIKLHLSGELPYGSAESLGLKEKGVGVADNENYRKLVPEDIRKKIAELEEKIISGEIKVKTAFGE